MARKHSLAAFAARLRKRPAVKDEILVLGAAEPVGLAVLGAVIHQYSECLSIVAVTSSRNESQRLLQRHPSISTAIGNIENPAFLENAAQKVKIVITGRPGALKWLCGGVFDADSELSTASPNSPLADTHASASSAAATAAAHLVHVLSHNPCAHTFCIHTTSTAMLHPSPIDPPYVAPPPNGCAAIAAATTAAVLKVRTDITEDPRGRPRTVWNDLADIDEICGLPMSRGYTSVNAAVREAVQASEKWTGKKENFGRVRLAIVAPGVVYGAESRFGSPEEVVTSNNKSVGVVHMDDLVQLYLRLVNRAILGPDYKREINDEMKPWMHVERDWEECWGPHAFYFAVTEHVRTGELKQMLAKENQRVGLGEHGELVFTVRKEPDEGVVEIRCCSERARWILGWAPQNWLENS